VRLLFLSDTHLGFDLPARPRSARPRRGADFLESYERALAPARAGEVDAVLHGGDLLYRSRVPGWLSEAALAPLRALAAAGLPVVLVPGNHERSEVPHPLLALQARLHVLDRPRTVAVEAGGLRVAFTGFPYAREVRARFPALLAEARAGEPPADVRLLCLHQCVEGATCGPADFTFRHGDDVVRRAALPRDVAAVLCGHVHRHQVLRAPGVPPVVYAGSTERTSSAEAGEVKGTVLLELSRAGLERVELRALPDRPPPPRPAWRAQRAAEGPGHAGLARSGELER
jgi:DNA repair exonuclease SbcCD nuclease subunit